MVEQWVPFAAVVGVVLASFLFNMIASPKLMRAINTPVEVNTPWRRPKLISGKSLVTLWFASAILYLSTLPGVLQISGVDLEVWSLPALILLLGTTLTASTYKRALAQQPDEVLDERELALRNILYPVSYQILGMIVAVFTIVTFITMFDINTTQTLSLPSETLVGGSVTAVLFIWVLPSLVHAWRDPVPDEVSEETQRALKDAKGELRREFNWMSIEIDAAGNEVKDEIRNAMGLGGTSIKKKRNPRRLKVAVNGRVVRGTSVAKKAAKPAKKRTRP
jgi:hypothetical protein